MIVLEQVTKTVVEFGRTRSLLSNADLQIPSDRRVALLCESKADSSQLIDLLSGVILPTSGRVLRKGRVSFPAGFTGGFDPALSVRFNVAHAARLYDADVESVVEFVRTIADLGDAFDKPLAMLPTLIRRTIAGIVALAIPFDQYVLAFQPKGSIKGDRLIDKYLALLMARAKSCGIIVPVTNLSSVRVLCDSALVLHEGHLLLFDDLEQAQAACRDERLRFD